MRTALLIGLTLVLTVSCADSADPPNAPPVGSGGAALHAGPPGTGTVLETMNSGGYTYAKVRNGAGEYWAAGPEVKIAVGGTVSVSEGMPMRGYHSKTLDRTFDVVYFVSAIRPTGPAPAADDDRLAAAHGTVPQPAVEDVAPVEKLEGGLTVEQIVNDAASRAGADVAVRGRVVKYNGGILGRNWVHIQDGSGADLTVTTDDVATVGDVVVVRGKVAVDKDFGSGYRYPVIVEDAALSKE